MDIMQTVIQGGGIGLAVYVIYTFNKVLTNHLDHHTKAIDEHTKAITEFREALRELIVALRGKDI